MNTDRVLAQEQYIPISEAITVMLCQATSSRSRLLLVVISPLSTSMLKSASPSAFWSMEYLKLQYRKLKDTYCSSYDNMHFRCISEEYALKVILMLKV